MNTLFKVLDEDSKGEWKKRMVPAKRFKKIDIDRGFGKKMIEARWNKILNKNVIYKDFLKNRSKDPYLNQPEMEKFYRDSIKDEILDEQSYNRSEVFQDNVENYIGTVKMPVGIAGPLQVNGLHARGEYFIPLATTEASLVASIHKGIQGINQSGGASCAVLMEGVDRDPLFCFRNLSEVFEFMKWSSKNFDKYKEVAETASRFGKLVDIRYLIDGHDVHMKCVYTSGDASGQNMVTICTTQILEYIKANSPVKPRFALVEGGLSGDKKATHAVLHYVRGKRVVAECIFKRDVCQTVFHSSPEQMVRSTSVGVQSFFWNGTIGINQHFSNAITAMAIALGQDPACSSESHIGVARAMLTQEGNLYVSVTLPNLLVGTVGGGTKLPSQKACLELMGLLGSGNANALAEVVAAVCLAGEVSLGSAIVSGDFAKAHRILRTGAGESEEINPEKDSLDQQFIKAQALLVRLSELPSKDMVMDIYALYMQATHGDINYPKPKVFSSKKVRAKYEAWKKMKGLSPKEAKRKYVKIMMSLSKEDEARMKKQKEKISKEKNR